MTRRPDAIKEKKRAAAALRQAHQFEAAAEELRSAIALCPDDVELHLELGDILLRRKRPAEAAEALTRALALAPADPEKLLTKRAEAYWALGKLKEAFLDLRRCAEASPTAGQLPLRAARAALACGDEAYVDSVIAAWDGSGKKDDRSRADFLRGLRSLSRRRYDEAATAFDRSEASFPGEVPRATYAALAKGFGWLARGKA